MMNATTFLAGYIRPVFYSLTIVLGLSVCFSELDSGNVTAFWQLGFIISLIFFIELYTGWDFRQKLSRQYKFAEIDEYGKAAQFLHHLVIPLASFWSILLFGFYNRQSDLRNVLLITAFLVFTVLFTQIRAFYQHKTTLIKQTNYIYDIVKLLLFFNFANTIFNLNVTLYPTVFAVLLIVCLSFVLMFLSVIRYQRLSVRGIWSALGLAVLIGAMVLACGLLSPLNPLQLSFIATMGYYLCIATLYHSIHGDLTKSLIIEYALVMLLAIVLLSGSSL